MTNIKAKLSVDLGGDFIPQAQRVAERMNRFSLSMTRSMRVLRAEAHLTTAALGAPIGHLDTGAVRTDLTALDHAVHTLTSELRHMHEQMHVSSFNPGAARVEITAIDHAVHSLTSGLGRMDSQLHLNTQALSQFRREATQTGTAAVQLQGRMSRMGARMGMMAAGTAAIATTAFLRKDIQLEDAMLQVKSNLVSGAKDAPDLNRKLKEVRDTARDLSEMTTFSDAEMIQLTNQLLKSGVNPEFISGKQGAAAGTAALAQLNGLDPVTAAEYMGALGNAFSFKSKKEYMDLANYIGKADDASAMNSTSILYNVKQGSANAAALHIDPRKLVAMNAYMDSLGDEAGTSINRFLESLAGVSKIKRKEIAKSGMDFWDEGKNGVVTMKPIDKIVDIVRDHFRPMKNEQQKINQSHQIFGEEGARAALLFSSKDQSFTDFQASVDQSTGSFDKLEIQMGGLGSAASRLGNTVLSLADEQFAGLRVAITDVINYTNENLQGKKSAWQDTKEFAIKNGAGIWEATKEGSSSLFNGLSSTLGLSDERLLFPSSTSGLSDKQILPQGAAPVSPPQKIEVTLKNLSDTPLKLQSTATFPNSDVSLKNTNNQTSKRAGAHY